MRMRRLSVVLSILALCLPALALADGSPHERTLVGTLTANPAGSVTVASSTASLTCSVPDRAIGSVAKLKLGGHFKITCRAGGGTLALVTLKRVDAPAQSPSDPGKTGSGSGGTTTHGDGSTAGTEHPPATPPPPGNGGAAGGDNHPGGATTGTTPTPPPPPPPPTGGGDNHPGGTATGTTPTPPPPPPPSPPPSRDARGVVSSLSSTGVVLTPDGGGTPLSCAITPAPDSAAAAAKLTLGAHVGIVCRLDGTHYVLSGATPVS
jgi:hypothetical protein